VSLLEDAKVGMLAILKSRLEQEGSTSKGVADAFNGDGSHYEDLAARIGYAAIKYADLHVSREKDYIAVFLMFVCQYPNCVLCKMQRDFLVVHTPNITSRRYTYARISSIIEKASALDATASSMPYKSEGGSPKERAMALRVLRFQETVEQTAAYLAPHILCSYLFKLCQETSTFVSDEDERIIDRDLTKLEPKRGAHRLALLKAVKPVLFEGLALLGIENPPEKM